MKEDYLIKKLLSLNLAKDDFAVFGSGPMLAVHLRDEIHDLDIIARDKAWDKACKIGKSEKAEIGGRVVRFFGNKIEIFDTWIPGDWDVDELINTAKWVEGIKFVTLENVLKWKKLMGRDKDFTDIEKIEEYLKNPEV